MSPQLVLRSNARLRKYDRNGGSQNWEVWCIQDAHTNQIPMKASWWLQEGFCLMLASEHLRTFDCRMDAQE